MKPLLTSLPGMAGTAASRSGMKSTKNLVAPTVETVAAAAMGQPAPWAPQDCGDSHERGGDGVDSMQHEADVPAPAANEADVEVLAIGCSDFGAAH